MSGHKAPSDIPRKFAEEERFEPLIPGEERLGNKFVPLSEMTDPELVRTPEEELIAKEETRRILVERGVKLLPALCRECDDVMPLCPNCRR